MLSVRVGPHDSLFRYRVWLVLVRARTTGHLLALSTHGINPFKKQTGEGQGNYLLSLLSRHRSSFFFLSSLPPFSFSLFPFPPLSFFLSSLPHSDPLSPLSDPLFSSSPLFSWFPYDLDDDDDVVRCFIEATFKQTSTLSLLSPEGTKA